jgi:hypothetical protein
MFAANAYPIRRTAADLLVGEIDGRPAAAISIADDRVTTNPFQPTTRLVQALRLRAAALRAYERTPSVRERLIAGVRVQAIAT